VREAAQFQLRFNELWENDAIWNMSELSLDIEAALLRAKRDNQRR
jgi:putative GTP pyrophosphokinase